MRRHSPYNYAFNSPIFWIDPDGMSPMINLGYTEQSAATVSGSVEFSGTFDSAPSVGGSMNEKTSDVEGTQNSGSGVNMPNGHNEGMASSGSGSGDGNVINPNNAVELDEVVVSVVINRSDVTISDTSWLVSNTADAIKLNARANQSLIYNYRNAHYSATEMTAQNFSRMSGIAKNGFRASVATTVVLGSIDIINGMEKDGNQFGYNAQKATAGTLGGAAGALAGAKAGAVFGGGVGLLFGGVGSGPGALIGGIIGGFVGGYYGAQKGESFVNSAYKK